MRIAGGIACILVAGVCAAGCGEDEPAGSGGSSGAGAVDGGSGASGQAGSGGGSGGQGGSGAAGGSGGTGGSDASASGGSSGTAGASGSAGAGGSAGGATLGKCVEKCVTDGDCAGPGGTHICDQFGRCRAAEQWSEICAVDTDCIAQASNWTLHCKTLADCTAPSVCVDIGGGIGKCAPTGSAPLCLLAPDEFEMPKIDGSGNVTVCGDESWKCHPGAKQCVPSCQSSSDCSLVPDAPSCVDGVCGCEQNADCSSGFCNLATNFCGCDGANDCTVTNPVCGGGACGCSSASDCQQFYPQSDLQCE